MKEHVEIVKGVRVVTPIVNNQILLTFADAQTAEYVKLVCRRKGTSLESYIVDNFEWDDALDCVDDCGKSINVNRKVCEGCDYYNRCPDAKKKKKKKKVKTNV